MKMLRVLKTPCFDCFFGDGWYNWCRVLLKPTKNPQAKNKLLVIPIAPKDKKLTAEQVQEIYDSIPTTKESP